MIIIKNNSTDPYFNLASEEYLIDNVDEDIFMLWQNEKAVIVGKNQNTASEVNREYCIENGIKVVRRLTGGGAVFHDMGNINFTYIQKTDASKFNNYSFFSTDIIDYLSSLGVKAELSGRNDILVEGKKIIGNAQCVRNGKIMHHGCLLYSADLSKLAGALKVSKAKIESKGIKSVSSRVVNVCSLTNVKMTATDFIKGLEKFISSRYNCNVRDLSEEEKSQIQSLADSKYSTFDWNFGSSPDYSFNNTVKFPFGLVTAGFSVSCGKISTISISGDFFGQLDISGLEDALVGCSHDPEAIKAVLDKTDIDSFIKGSNTADIIKLFL